MDSQLTFHLGPLALIYIIAFTQALFMSVALWRRSESGQASRILSVMMLAFAYKLYEGAAMYSNLYQWVAHTLDWLPGAALLFGPLFYGYIRQVFTGQPLTARQWLLHMSPAILLVLYNSPNLLIPAQQKIDNISLFNNFEGTIRLPMFVVVLLIGIKIHLGTYLIKSWLLLSKYGKRIKDLRADDSARSLHRHQMLCLALILLEMVWVGLFLSQQFTPFVALDYVSKSWLLFMSVIILGMGYSGLQIPELLLNKDELAILRAGQDNVQNESHGADDTSGNLTVVATPDEQNNEKYEQSSLDVATASQVAALIENYFATEQGFLNDKLTLGQLSEAISLKPHLVSQVINQHMHTSFYKLVNRYRVEQAIAFLKDDSLSWSIERIGLESGFANRVTFNNAFKGLQGCTPSQYRKKDKLAG